MKEKNKQIQVMFCRVRTNLYSGFFPVYNPDRNFCKFCRTSTPVPVTSVSAEQLFDGMCGSGCSIEKVGIEKALFRLRKNVRFSLRSETALFDPPIRLRKNCLEHMICISLGWKIRTNTGCANDVVGYVQRKRLNVKNHTNSNNDNSNNCYPRPD